jgi:AcrR family transcriptional regulator
VGSTDATAPRRRGRPPDTKSSETYESLLDGARQLFGERGFGAVTNKDLAAAAGVTTGALYHYVESKLDLYVAVHDDMQQRIYRRFQIAERSEDTFLGKLQAVLDAAQSMNEEDPSLAKFVGVVRADLRRHPEVVDRLGSADAARERFFVEMVECGVESGEVRRQDVALLQEFIRVILIGLTEGTSDSPLRQRRAIDSIMAVMHGTLITPVSRPA